MEKIVIPPKKVDKQLFRDLTFSAVERMREIILTPHWKMKFKQFGQNSKIKKGVLIVGSAKRISIGENTTIFHRVILTVWRGNIEIGNYSHIGVNSYLNASKSKIKIGNYVAIAPYTQIYSYSDQYEQEKIIGECHLAKDVIIEDNVLIGSGAKILPGVIIYEGAIVGAGAVVTEDVAPYTIVAGIPAKVIKKRPR